MNPTKKVKIECPYLSQIQRHLLDFDLIMQCSICLSKTSIYCCLTCGKFFEGTGSTSHAYLHALEKEHNLYINTETEVIICLPDSYTVDDDELLDIKYNLKPVYSNLSLQELQAQVCTHRAVDGQSFITGLIALNSPRNSAYARCILYSLLSIPEIRNQLLLNNYSGITQAIGQVFKKMWNPRSFKNHVCLHEFFNVLSNISAGKFNAYSKNDPQNFLPWVLNQMKKEGFLKGLIERNIEGKLEIKGKNIKFM